MTLLRGMMQMLRYAVATTLAIGLMCSHGASAQTPKPAATAAVEKVSPEEARQRKEWSLSMMKKPAPPKGCFTAAYPRTEWQAVQCRPAPNIPMIPRHGPRPFVIGNNNDISAKAPSGFITQAIGHFDTVTNVTSASGPIGNTGPSVNNAYTLQINADFFTSAAACTGSPNPNCQAWEQWVFANDGNAGAAFMQY